MSEPVKVIEPMSTPRITKIVVEIDLVGPTHDVQVVEDGHDSRRATADRVEERDQLGHSGHGHAEGQEQAHTGADGEADDDDDQRLGGQATDRTRF